MATAAAIEGVERAYWMSVLAQASPAELAAAWSERVDRPAYQHLRRPETGLVMVRARARGAGPRFNLGEMPVTRCSVKLEDGSIGHSYVAGRNHAHAELAAVLDALFQDPTRRAEVEEAIIRPLAARQAARRRGRATRNTPARPELLASVHGEG